MTSVEYINEFPICVLYFYVGKERFPIYSQHVKIAKSLFLHYIHLLDLHWVYYFVHVILSFCDSEMDAPVEVLSYKCT